MNSVREIFSTLSLGKQLLSTRNQLPIVSLERFYKYKKHDIPTPKPGGGKQFRRLVHYPEDYKYTVKPLNVTHLAGRDPVTGRVVAKGIGGGVKHKYHWVKYDRDGPEEGPPQEERVIDVMFDGHRSANVALVGTGDKLRYIIATEKMKPGDIIKTSRTIPRIPVRPNEGDAYPLGALPVGTIVHCIENVPGINFHKIRAAGTFGTILRKFGKYVVVQDTRKHELAFDETCMATVGRVSNIGHQDVKLGSHQKNRELGNRPRSGLWQRKGGRFGRKIKPHPPMRIISVLPPPKPEKLFLTMDPHPEPVPIYGNAF